MFATCKTLSVDFATNLKSLGGHSPEGGGTQDLCVRKQAPTTQPAASRVVGRKGPHAAQAAHAARSCSRAHAHPT